MSSECFLPEISRHYDALTPAQKKLADYAMRYPSEVVNASAAEFAARAGTAPSAVIRFCQALGYDGFSAFKLQLAVVLSRQAPASYMTGVGREDSSTTVLDKIFTANIQALRDTAARIDRQAFTKTVQLLSNARRIHIYGVGSSAQAVQELHYRLMLLGAPVQCFTDIVAARLSTMHLGPEDLAIGISHSGRTCATVDALTLSKQAGAKTVCLTSYSGSPITEVSDHVLTVFCDETRYPIEATAARVAQIGVLDALVAALAAQRYEETLRRSEQIHDMIEPLRRKRKKG